MSESKSEKKPILFSLGQLVATPGALLALQRSNQSYIGFIARHLRGDWGEVLCKEDWELNDQAVKEGTRILSAYKTSQGEKIWIITEWDHSVSTILLPSEY